NAAEALGFIGNPEVSSKENQTAWVSDSGDAQHSPCCGDSAMIVRCKRRTDTGGAIHDARFGDTGSSVGGGHEGKHPGPAVLHERSSNFRQRSFNGGSVSNEYVACRRVNIQTAR